MTDTKVNPAAPTAPAQAAPAATVPDGRITPLRDKAASTLTLGFLHHADYKGALFIDDDKAPLIRSYRSEWYVFGGTAWVKLTDDEIGAEVFNYLDGLKYWDRSAKEPAVRTLRATKHLENEAINALKMYRAKSEYIQEAMRSVLMPDIDGPIMLDPLAFHERDIDPRSLIAFNNCIVNVRTGTRYPSALGRCVFLIRHVPINLPVNVGEPVRWFKFLSELWPDPADADQILALQLWFAYVLTGRTDLHKLLMLVGPPRCGKSTIARILMAMIGLMNVASPTLASLAGQFGMAPLIGKMLAVIADARLSGRADQAAIMEVLLAVVGEDSVTINRKYLDPIVTTLRTLFLIISNEIPRLADTSGAFLSRTILIRITESFEGRENPQLTQELLAELPQIVGWALAGVPLLEEHGGLIQPNGSAQLMGELADLASPVKAFLRECCVVDADATIGKPALYRAWLDWCDSEGRMRLTGTAQTFSRDLRAACPKLGERRTRSTGENRNAPRSREWIGVGLRADQGAPRYLTEGVQRLAV